jgi:hypothetical protein
MDGAALGLGYAIHCRGPWAVGRESAWFMLPHHIVRKLRIA